MWQHVDATVRSTDTKMHALSLSVDLDIQVVSELMNVKIVLEKADAK